MLSNVIVMDVFMPAQIKSLVHQIHQTQKGSESRN